jgi:hypothetical protein
VLLCSLSCYIEVVATIFPSTRISTPSFSTNTFCITRRLLIHDYNWDIDVIDSSLHTSIVAPHVINPSTLHTRSNIAPLLGF